MIGSSASVSTSSRCRSRPLSPGSRTSSTRHPGASGRRASRNSRALANISTLNPADVMSRRNESRMDGSSSTTKTTAPVADASAAARRGTSRRGVCSVSLTARCSERVLATIDHLEREVCPALHAAPSALRIAWSSAGPRTGFSRNAVAPFWSVRWRMSLSPCAVRMITGIRVPESARHLRRPSPPIPGICRSSTRQPVLSSEPDSRNTSADSNVSTRSPADIRRFPRDRRSDASSSTIETIRASCSVIRFAGHSPRDSLAARVLSRAEASLPYLRRVRRHGESDVPNGGVRPVGGGPKPATMRLDDRAADRQAHAHAPGFVVKNAHRAKPFFKTRASTPGNRRPDRRRGLPYLRRVSARPVLPSRSARDRAETLRRNLRDITLISSCVRATATVNEVSVVPGSGQKDQLRRQLQMKLDSIAARLYRETKVLSTEFDGGNFIDVAQGLERLEQEQLIASRLMKQARRLRGALTRLDEGEYGVCSECVARIPQKRLLAVPDAATCVVCQDRLEHYTRSARC